MSMRSKIQEEYIATEESISSYPFPTMDVSVSPVPASKSQLKMEIVPGMIMLSLNKEVTNCKKSFKDVV